MILNYAHNLKTLLLLLKKKFAYIAVAFLLGFILSFHFSASMISHIKNTLLPEGAVLVYVSPLEILLLKVKIAIVLGSLFALPVIAYSIGRMFFTSKNELIRISRFRIWTYFFASLITFLLGASYAYFLMLPLFIKFLYLNSSVSGISATYSIFKFISLTVQATVIFGLIFELPVVLLVLTRSNLIRYSTLVAYRKHIYVLFLIIGALITPPDVFSQMLVAIPLIVLFEISLIIVRFTGAKKAMN